MESWSFPFNFDIAGRYAKPWLIWIYTTANREIRAVGFENRIRSLMKLDQRKQYGNERIIPYNKEE